jgi:hypothetical protein
MNLTKKKKHKQQTLPQTQTKRKRQILDTRINCNCILTCLEPLRSKKNTQCEAMKLRDGRGITLLLLMCLATLSLKSEAVWLTIPSTGTKTKCVSEEIQTHVVVLADYYVVSDEGQHTIIAKVCFIFNYLP